MHAITCGLRCSDSMADRTSPRLFMDGAVARAAASSVARAARSPFICSVNSLRNACLRWSFSSERGSADTSRCFSCSASTTSSTSSSCTCNTIHYGFQVRFQWGPYNSIGISIGSLKFSRGFAPPPRPQSGVRAAAVARSASPPVGPPPPPPTAMQKSREKINRMLGISGGRALTRPFRDARRFPSTRS
jgi:hypothetical protein